MSGPMDRSLFFTKLKDIQKYIQTNDPTENSPMI